MAISVVDLGVHPDGLETLLSLQADDSVCYPHLCASTAQRVDVDNYSMLFSFPATCLVLGSDGRLRLDGKEISGLFLPVFDKLWASQAEPFSSYQRRFSLPFFGGWFVYCGYELVEQYERLSLPQFDSEFPRAFAVRFRSALIYHHESKHLFALSEDDADSSLRLRRMKQDVSACRLRLDTSFRIATDQLREEAEERYYTAYQRCREYIYAGDVFQVNLSRLWHVATEHLLPDTAVALFCRLWRHNPSPFAALSIWEDKVLLSSSPERLVRVIDGRMETRPIAGTRPRSSDVNRDKDYARVLLADPKERAEHIMLVDLERNDLSKVCIAGSVIVDELMVLESYAHVHHIVSNVCGRVATSLSPGSVLSAVFPGGTITGCPKLRCIEILAELETVGRGFYTGSLGYVNHDGSLDMNILIRTLFYERGVLSFRAGGGIVADSNAEHELAETRAKARGLLHALSF